MRVADFERSVLMRFKKATCVLVVILATGLIGVAQQKGQYVPGQAGLDAGILGDPGISYANLDINYSAGTLNNSNGNGIKGISGNYSFWAVENVFKYMPPMKVLGGHLAAVAFVTAADGSLVADLGNPPKFSANAGSGGFGLADTYIQPFTLGWKLKRAETWVGYGFVAPTGRYTSGATNNIGSGYWGNQVLSGTTVYLTKNKGTTANLLTDWEIHGQKQVASVPAGQLSKITPGQAFTMEWGLGQFLPLDKQMKKLLEFGVVGYDQWQVSANGGNYLLAGTPAAASRIPYYSVQSVGFQSNFILPPQHLALFFKYYYEYSAKARPVGRTFALGLSWTFPIPEP
jgi:hypothetical protein